MSLEVVNSDLILFLILIFFKSFYNLYCLIQHIIPRNLRENIYTYFQGFTVLADVHPIGRMGTTEQVAKAVLYLASDDGGTMTGSNLLMDGGASLAGASLFIPDTQ